MKLKSTGKNISNVEVVQITPFGIWIVVNEYEYFLPYSRCPWFKAASVAQIHHVILIHQAHLRWPDLDVDLHLDSFIHPEKYPLTYR